MKKLILIIALSTQAYASHNEEHYWKPDNPGILQNNIAPATKINRRFTQAPLLPHLFYSVEFNKAKAIIFLSAYKYTDGPQKGVIESWQSIWQPTKPCTHEKVDNRLFDQLKKLYQWQQTPCQTI